MKKKKVIITLTACLLAAGSFINMHMGQNVHSTDFSLADISVMAQADSENGKCPGWDGVTAYCQWDEERQNCFELVKCGPHCIGGCDD